MARHRDSGAIPPAGTVRGDVVRLVIDEPRLSTDQLATRLGLPRGKVAIALRATGFSLGPEDAHPCGDPAASDRLLAALWRAHPAGADNMVEPPERGRWWRPPDLSGLIGCSAGYTADFGDRTSLA